MKKFSCLAVQDEWATRKYDDRPHEFRSNFARDRDRIMYSKEFRRLSGKTQVFVVGFDDHCRTRLTHTIEVAQIARTISERLGLNTELTEAIALGHDVGHTPFGHVGERFLNLLMNGCYELNDLDTNLPDAEKGFKHNWQGIRVASSLEKLNENYEGGGLNLTYFTLWGILNHTKRDAKKCDYVDKEETNEGVEELKCGYRHKDKTCPNKGEHKLDFYNKYGSDLPDSQNWSYEAFVVDMADEIAQRHHDIEDGIEAGILKKDELVEKIEHEFKDYIDKSDYHKELIESIKDKEEKTYYLPLLSKFIVDFLTTNLINESEKNLRQFQSDKRIGSGKYFKEIRKKLDITEEKERINYDKELAARDKSLRDYLFSRIINSHLAQKMDGKSDFLLRQLIKAYTTNPRQLPDSTIITLFKNLQKIINDGELNSHNDASKKLESAIKSLGKNIDQPGDIRIVLNKLHKEKAPEYCVCLLRTITDYIAGMTDHFAIKQYNILYGTDSNWQGMVNNGF
ncbi:deoxyguanosinetriphosphate triphosphohydrolase family protein [Natranaerobius trueperi]|uniref:HD domain-containing protein n=1 Tax=Natranaerobius trueperi TaxID=759412 RepID=A0A226BWJ6_9FIRM|nr:dNTP triphosphohydrolase [Natranaerobius trueperi]OWZ83373.1 hypothetical protein CDO51_09135 [Natranaerobius trueperi]